jgi:hypothetical protein
MGLRPIAYQPHQSGTFLDRLANPSDRKLRLFMIECFRRVADVWQSPSLHSLLAVIAGHVDGQRSSAELFAAYEDADESDKPILLTLTRAGGLRMTREQMPTTADWVVRALAERQYPDVGYEDPDYWPKRCELMREEDDLRLTWLDDIFGGPCETRTFPAQWLSESAVALARTAYDTRDFALLPILADALEEAGCDHPDVLAHCRDPKQVHVRGCWVLDGVLGRT